MLLKPRTGELLLVSASGIVLLLCYQWMFSGFFPAANGTVGHDYAYFLPALLDGYYWQLNNGVFTPQWFSPAFCGGLPAFPSPQNLYYSLPQWLTAFVDPLTAVYLTLLSFAALGFAGFYLLLRVGFQTAIASALLGAALFMFNGFFSHRILIGHLTYHAFMLAPLIAFLLLPDANSSKRLLNLKAVMNMSIAALLLSYTIYSGMIHLVIPVVVILLLIGTLHGLVYKTTSRFWLQLVIAGVASIILSLPKLAPAIMYVGNFERTSYLLPGASTLWGLLTLVFEVLFVEPSAETIKAVLTNVQWAPARHELEYGITFIPLLAILVSGILLIKNLGGIKPCVQQTNATTWLQLGFLALLLSMPLALNYYTPDWNATLKEIPIIKHSSLLVRWFSVYIPITILIATLLLDKSTQLKRFLPGISAIAIVAVVIINANVERDYYANQPYKSDTIVNAHTEAKQQGQAKTINQITVFQDKQGRLAMPIFRNDSLISGASQLLCYEPLFGYRLEQFPMGMLRPGLVSWAKDGFFNLKNPACYLFGDANHCTPGDHFSIDQQDEAKAFVSYQAFEFSLPGWLKLINWVSLILLTAILLLWLSYPFIVYIGHKKSLTR